MSPNFGDKFYPNANWSKDSSPPLLFLSHHNLALLYNLSLSLSLSLSHVLLKRIRSLWTFFLVHGFTCEIICIISLVLVADFSAANKISTKQNEETKSSPPRFSSKKYCLYFSFSCICYPTR